jgi:hypothetical protein
MTAIPVPAKESDVTPAWLNQALAASYPAIAARAVRRERIGAGFGLAGQLYRCRLQADHGPTSVVVKLWATDSPAGTREATFYRQLAPIVKEASSFSLISCSCTRCVAVITPLDRTMAEIVLLTLNLTA